jgi:hypothetical protein
MPVVFCSNGYRFFFFSNEGSPREPLHVHVRRGGDIARIWLEPQVALAESYGFKSRELSDIVTLVQEHRSEIERAWHEHFGD